MAQFLIIHQNWNHRSHHVTNPNNALLLMEEILHHLECINLVNNGIHYLPTGAGFLPSTVFKGTPSQLPYIALFDAKTGTGLLNYPVINES